MIYKAKIPLAKCFGKARRAPPQGQEGEHACLGGSGFPSMEIDPKGVLRSENNKAPMFPFAIPPSSCGSVCSPVVTWVCQGIFSGGVIPALCCRTTVALPTSQFLQGGSEPAVLVACWARGVTFAAWSLCSQPVAGRQMGRKLGGAEGLWPEMEL